jgi:hypothetical protein
MSAFTEPISVGIGGRPQRACSSSERGGHGGANGRAWADGPEVAATPRPKCRLELSTGGRTCMVGARRRVRDAAFDAEVFLGIVRGKSMAFVGDSLARNHAGVGSLGAVQGRGAVAAKMERHKVTRGGEEERGGEMRGLTDVMRSGGAGNWWALPTALLLSMPLVGATHLRRGEGHRL